MRYDLDARAPQNEPGELSLPERSRSIDSPVLSQRAAKLLELFGIRAQPDDPRLLVLRAATVHGDPLADAFVRYCEGAPAGLGRGMFERALSAGIETVVDAPDELRALFTELDAVPVWLDRKLAKAGAEAMMRQGPEGLCALSAVSLMGGYLSSYATKPLAHTGALLSMAPRRLAETTQFVHAIETSDGMGRQSDGFQTTVRVRVMHAFVRARLSASPDWDARRWGIPINQRDMVATHLSFTLLFVAGASALGRIVTVHEREAIIHLWRYVSYLLGTPDALLPKTFREAAELGGLINISEPGPDADGRALAAALMAAWNNGGPRADPRVARLFGAFMAGFSRYALGGEAADRLGIPDTPWKWVAPALSLIRLANELADLALPGGSRRAVAAGRRVVDQHIARVMRGEPARYVAELHAAPVLRAS